MIKEKKDQIYLHFLLFGRTNVLCLRTREGLKPRSSG